MSICFRFLLNKKNTTSLLSHCVCRVGTECCQLIGHHACVSPVSVYRVNPPPLPTYDCLCRQMCSGLANPSPCGVQNSQDPPCVVCLHNANAHAHDLPFKNTAVTLTPPGCDQKWPLCHCERPLDVDQEVKRQS